MAATGDAVELSDISLTYVAADGQPLEAVASTTLTIPAGQFVSLVGPSGCGKTSLLRLIAGLQQPTSGSISIFGDDPLAAQRLKELGLVFQQPALLPGATSSRTSASDASSTPARHATASPSTS